MKSVCVRVYVHMVTLCVSFCVSKRSVTIASLLIISHHIDYDDMMACTDCLYRNHTLNFLMSSSKHMPVLMLY